MPAAERPREEEARTWLVRLVKQESSLGITFTSDTATGVLIVADIKPGRVVERFNQANPSLAIQRRDLSVGFYRYGRWFTGMWYTCTKDLPV